MRIRFTRSRRDTFTRGLGELIAGDIAARIYRAQADLCIPMNLGTVSVPTILEYLTDELDSRRASALGGTARDAIEYETARALLMMRAEEGKMVNA